MTIHDANAHHWRAAVHDHVFVHGLSETRHSCVGLDDFWERIKDRATALHGVSFNSESVIVLRMLHPAWPTKQHSELSQSVNSQRLPSSNSTSLRYSKHSPPKKPCQNNRTDFEADIKTSRTYPVLTTMKMSTVYYVAQWQASPLDPLTSTRPLDRRPLFPIHRNGETSCSST